MPHCSSVPVAGLALFAIPFFVVPSAGAQELQWAQNPGNQHWLGIPYRPNPRAAGETLAGSLNGCLATIRSLTENNWIAATFPASNVNGYWIGLNDLAMEGTYAWPCDNSTYTNWNTGQPNNGGGVQDGVVMLPGAAWKWDDVDAALPSYLPLVERSQPPLLGWTLPDVDAVQDQPGALATGDFNLDGRADVIVPNRGSSSVTILLGQPSGGLTLQSTAPTAAGPVAVAVGHFDGGTNLDVAIACYDAQLVRILFGDGAGGLHGTVVDLPLGARPISIATAHLDGDGLLDIAVTTVDSQDRLRVLRSNGVNAFHPPAVYPTGSRPIAVTAGDLDGDGDVDLAVPNYDSDDVSLYFNQGAGTFLTGALLPKNNGPSRIALGDFNGDTRIDMVVPMRIDGLVRIVWGLGGGAFDLSGPLFEALNEPAWCSAADLDLDGRLDFVTASAVSDALVVFRSTGNWASPDTIELHAGDGVACVAVADVGGNALPELVASATISDQVVVLRNLAADCEGDGILDAHELAASPSLDMDGDLVLDECEQAGPPYCFGDGTGAACPCGPGFEGEPGTGCRNSAGSSGRLRAVGNPSVLADSVSLRASGLPPSAIGLFFQGNLRQNGGQGAAFGDGLQCATQAVVRLEIRSASAGGAMSFGRDVPGDPPVAQDGNVPPGGATRHYQVWYRDAATYCTSFTFNLTNGVTIVWQP